MLLCGPAEAADFDPRSDDWNGLGALASIAKRGGLELSNEALPAEAVGLMWIHPGAGMDADALRRFVRAGGRAVVADDFGESGDLFEAFGLALEDVDTGSLERLGGNPALPVARTARGWALANGVTRVVANHPAGVSGPGEIRLAFGGAAALAIEQRIGAGQVLFMSDPSLFINNMLELKGNRRFTSNLLDWLGQDGQGVRLYVGPTAGAGGGGAGQGWLDEIEEAAGLDRLRDHLPWLLLVAFGLAVILLAFLVPAGGERAWGGRDPGAAPARPARVGVRVASLAALPDDGDGRVLAAMVGSRARAALLAEGLTLGVAYERLAPRAADLPRGLSGLAALLQQVEETPPAADPYAPGGRRWTVAQALALDEGVQELMEGISGAGRHAA